MKLKTYFIAGLGLGFSHLSIAEISPWLPAPGALNLSLAQIEQNADEFYFGDQKQSLSSDLNLSTTVLNLSYGLSDHFALDASVGYARSEFDDAANNHLSGIVDSKVGLTWKIVNEHASPAWPSISARLGLIIDGDYETGTINAIGDGGDGAELSLAYGKVLNPYLAVSSDVGVRERNNGIPAEVFYGASLYLTPINQLTTFVSYRADNAQDGLQIGGAGFSPDRFPEVEEDKEYLQLGAQYALTDTISGGLSVAQVIDGRNTSLSDVYALSLGYQF